MGKALIAAYTGPSISNGGFLAPAGGGYSASSGEDSQSFLTRLAGTVSLLALRLNATGTNRTYRFRINAGNGNQVITPADGGSGFFEDATHSDTLSAGDKFAVQFNHSGSAPTIRFIRAVFEAGGNHACLYQCAGPVTIFVGNGTTYYFAPTARGDHRSTTEADHQLRIRAGGVAKNLHVYSSFNTNSSGTMVVRSRINGANGNLAVTITPGVTGRYEDSSNSDTLSPGDDFCLQWSNGGSGGSTAIGPIGVAIENAGAAKNDLFAGGDSSLGLSRSASGTATYYLITGSIVGASTTEADNTIRHGFDVTVTNLRCRIKSNSYSANATLKSRKNGADGNLSVTITAGVTGVFEDTTNSDSVAASDDYCAAIVGGSSGSIGVMWIGVTEEDPNAGGGGSTGTFAATEGADTASLAGDVLVKGALAGSEGADTASLSGNVRIAGALAGSEASDTASLEGAVSVRGTLAATEAGDSAALAGAVQVQGLLSATEGGDSVAFAGHVHVAGALAAAETGDTASLAGTVPVEGALAATEGADTASLSGSAVITTTGTLAATEGQDSASLVGNVPIEGSIEASETGDSSAISGLVLIRGAIAATEAADSILLSGGLQSEGTLAATEAPDTAAIEGKIRVAGTLAGTEQADNAAVQGNVIVGGAIAATEGDDTASLSGTAIIVTTGTLAASEGQDTAVLAGGVRIRGTLAANENSDSAAWAGLVLIRGGLAAVEALDTAAIEGSNPSGVSPVPASRTTYAAPHQGTTTASGYGRTTYAQKRFAQG